MSMGHLADRLLGEGWLSTSSNEFHDYEAVERSCITLFPNLQRYSESASGLDPEGESRKLYDASHRINGYSCDVD